MQRPSEDEWRSKNIFTKSDFFQSREEFEVSRQFCFWVASSGIVKIYKVKDDGTVYDELLSTKCAKCIHYVGDLFFMLSEKVSGAHITFFLLG